MHDNISSAYTEDIDNQTSLTLAQVQAEKLPEQPGDNYSYDAIGNLVKDTKENISNIGWNVYGKIKSITKTGSNISYTYDASGNRISKNVDGKETWYVRDASGNVMSIYTKDASVNGGHLTQSEIDLYGTSRLGIYNLANDMQSIDGNTGRIYTFTRGNKFFELSNHLGNVLATVDDKKIQHSSDGTTVDSYDAEVVNAQDYYPFGMLMPGRKYSIANTDYRYGFNGQEKSTEINGSGNLYTAEFWEYDSRIGRRWNVDPKPNVGISSYSGFANNPIFYSDPLGDTTVTGAGGRQSIDIDEKQNSLEYYNSNINYTVSGTQTPVPVQAGQLRSFSNALGKFSARWTTDANGTAAFAGYKNDKGQDLGAAVKELNEFASSWKYKLLSFGNWIKNEHDKDPIGFNLKLTTTLLTMSAMQAVEPVGYSTGYNPSVTFSEGSGEFGFGYRAINPAFAKSTTQNGFYMSGAAGRLGNDGIYVNSTIQGAVKEFQFHNPGMNPSIFEVRYPLSRPLLINPPSGYFAQPLPFTQDANILSAPSLRAPGTTNLLIRTGAEVGNKIK